MPVYRDIYDGPPRWYGAQRTDKGYIAIHCTENTASAQAENSYAKRRPDSVSSHYYVDGDSIVQSLDTDLRAFHAGSKIGNDHAIAYEITGLTSWSRQRWLDSVAWPLLVRQMRRDMAAHGIAPRRLTVEQMKAGKLSGIVTHDDMRLAWGGTDHTDPGKHFPMDYLVSLLAEEDLDVDEATLRRIIREETAYRNIRPAAWMRRLFPSIPDDGYDWASYSRAAYGYSRALHEQVAPRIEALVAQIAGEDVVAAVRAAMQPILDRLAAVQQLVEQRGERDAEQIVDEIARRLAEAG